MTFGTNVAVELDAGRGDESSPGEGGATGARQGDGRAPTRLDGVDRLRGLAVLLMVADHVALVAGAGGAWRLTVTRAALPLFCVVAGSLARPGRPGRRLGVVAAAGLAATVLGAPLGIGQPDVLFLLAGVLVLVRWVGPRPGGPAWAAVACLGVIQATTWPMAWTGYEVGTVLALVLVGQVVARRDLDQLGCRLPAVLAPVGRAPLWWYVGHLWVLLVVFV